MKKTKRFIVWSLVLLLAGTSLTACSNDDDENAPITYIEPHRRSWLETRCQLCRGERKNHKSQFL